MREVYDGQIGGHALCLIGCMLYDSGEKLIEQVFDEVEAGPMPSELHWTPRVGTEMWSQGQPGGFPGSMRNTFKLRLILVAYSVAEK